MSALTTAVFRITFLAAALVPAALAGQSSRAPARQVIAPAPSTAFTVDTSH